MPFQVPSDLSISLETSSEEGLNYYYKDEWKKAIDMFEKALIKHRMLQNIQSACSVSFYYMTKARSFAASFNKGENGFWDSEKDNKCFNNWQKTIIF